MPNDARLEVVGDAFDLLRESLVHDVMVALVIVAVGCEQVLFGLEVIDAVVQQAVDHAASFAQMKPS